uniref:Uncharacterized protein n=1 Tax=Tetranychus urticae TaxID=32264 RepID=T1KGD0_TETUR
MVRKQELTIETVQLRRGGNTKKDPKMTDGEAVYRASGIAGVACGGEENKPIRNDLRL